MPSNWQGSSLCLFIWYLYPMLLASLLYCTFTKDYQGRNIKSKGSFLCTFITQLTLNSLPYFKPYQSERICSKLTLVNIMYTRKWSWKQSQDYILLKANYLLLQTSQFLLVPMDSLFLENSVEACHKDRTYKQASWNLNSRGISKTYQHIFVSI